MFATSVIFNETAQSKQSPNGLKFAQSGHPGSGLNPANVSSYVMGGAQHETDAPLS
jgi:hypothetical protein